MDFNFSEEQDELAGLARQILGDVVTHERLRDLEGQDDRFDRDLWSKLADANLLGVAVPEAHGGMGYGPVELALVLVEVGRKLPLVPAFASLVLGASPIAAFGSEAQQTAWLPGIADGSKVLTGAFLEPAAYGATDLATVARADGDGWVLDGLKVCVPWAGESAAIVVPASTGEGGAGLFLVTVDAAGVTLTRDETTTHEPQYTLTLDGVRVGADGVLGATDSLDSVRAAGDFATAMTCALALGVAEAATRFAADYTIERHQFDVPVASFQAVHQRAADCVIDTMAVRLTAWQAIWRMAEDLEYTDQLAIAKYWAADGAYRVARAAIHLHGGIGVDVDYPLHRYYTWAKSLELTLGSAAPQLAVLGARMAAAPA